MRVMVRGATVLTISTVLGICACTAQTPSERSAEAAQPPARAASSPIIPPPPPADPLAVGSQDAKDDLYCAAIIFVSNPSPPSALNPVDEAVLRKAQMLGIVLAESGINKLVVQKAAHATHGGMISDAYTAQAGKDLAAKTPRISLEDCNARAQALPVIQ
jgi:hypothetical protein